MSPSSDRPPLTALRLPAELTIYAVGELQPQWLAWLADLSTHSAAPGADQVDVDAQAVDQVDAAGLQMLVSLQRTLADRGLRMLVQQPSATLLEGCGTLGLVDTLGLAGAPA
jgi:ABC-type transporter Mla MlaB component